MKGFIKKSVVITLLAQSFWAPTHANILDLPNPFDESIEGSEIIPTIPILPSAENNQSTQGMPPNVAITQFQNSLFIENITRKSKGLVYRIEIKPGISIKALAITATKSQLVLHETLLITEGGQKIAVNELSNSVTIANQSTKISESLNSQERIVAIDFRAESMKAEATLQVSIFSDENTPQLSLYKSEETASMASVRPESTHIICKNNGSNFQPYNSVRKIFIGKYGYGWQDQKMCEVATKASNSREGEVVCTWTGKGYSPYSTTKNRTIGQDDFGYSTLENCNDAIANSNQGLMCNWTGNGYGIHQIESTRAYGAANVGYDKISTCQAISKAVHNGLICHWSGRGYSAYRVKNGQTAGKQDFSVSKDLTVCIENIKTAKHDAICNWNGKGYSPYIISTNSQIGRTDYGYDTLSGCQEAISKAHKGAICNWTGEGYGLYSLKNKFYRNYSSLSQCLAQVP